MITYYEASYYFTHYHASGARKMSLDVNISEPEEFNCVELHSCLEDVSKLIGIDDFEYHVDMISGKGENYVANIFRVVIKEVGSEENHVNVIVKTLINTTRRDLFCDFHYREVLVYKEIIPKYKEIQSKLNRRQRIWFPECLYTNANRNKEVIILKDLKDIGFGVGYTATKYEELSFKQAKLILTELAKLHGLSFVYENTEKEKFNKIKRNFGDLLFQENTFSKSELRNYFFDSYNMSLELVSNVEVKKKLENVKSKLLDLLNKYNQPSSKHNVLCHGDLWTNNILFKQENEEDEICFLDYQVMRYCCPAIDIIYFIYLCTTSKFRSDHFEDLQQAYYDSLNSFLRLFDIDAQFVYPREDFENDLKDNLPFGFVIALVELRIITTTPEDEAILRGSKTVPGFELTKVPGEVDLFKFRVNDLVEESVNNGVLEKLLSSINV